MEQTISFTIYYDCHPATLVRFRQVKLYKPKPRPHVNIMDKCRTFLVSIGR